MYVLICSVAVRLEAFLAEKHFVLSSETALKGGTAELTAPGWPSGKASASRAKGMGIEPVVVVV